MVTLPVRPRRAWLQSFWLGLCLAGGAAGAALAAWREVPWGPGAIAVATALAAAAGLVAPDRVRLAYRAWNRAARAYARLARLAVLAVGYHVVVAAVGRLGSTVVLQHEPASLWVPRTPPPAESYASQDEGAAGRTAQRPWLVGLGWWSVRSGNGWVVALLPFLLLVSLLGAEDAEAQPADIYTLF
jgi:hypothetical protein